MHTSRSSFPMRTLVVTLGLALLGIGLVATPAAAKPGGSGTSTAGTTNHNCVISLRAGNPGQAPATCFSTFTAAIRHATGGAVTDAPATAARAFEDPGFAEKVTAAGGRSAAGTAVQSDFVGIEYEAADYSIASWSLIFMGNIPCTAFTNDVDYQYSLPEYLGGARVWDAISSFETHFPQTMCWASHYYLAYYGLPATPYLESQPTMPKLDVGGGPFDGDNNTRSIQWT